MVSAGGGLLFLGLSYIPYFEDFKLFGDFPLLLYKFGDMGVHLLISSLLMLNGYVHLSKKHAIVNTILTMYLFMVISAYSRSGMVAYGLGMFLFLCLPRVQH